MTIEVFPQRAKIDKLMRVGHVKNHEGGDFVYDQEQKQDDVRK